MNDLGFFCINRKIFEHEIWKDPEKVRAWIELIGYYARGTDNCTVKRGQFKASYSEMAKRWGWSVRKVRVFLEYLKAESMLEVVTSGLNEHQSTVYQIANYDKYNGTVTKRQTPTKTQKGIVNGTADGTVKPMSDLPFTESHGTADGTVNGTAEFAYKEETKKNNVKQEESISGALKNARPHDEAADQFCEIFEELRGPAKYQLRKGDFVCLAERRKTQGVESRGTPPAWGTACRNYLSSPLSRYSLADLAERYDVFLQGVVDRYGKPAKARTNGKIEYEFETREEARIRKQKEAGQRFRQSLLGSTSDAIGSSDPARTNGALCKGIGGSK